MAVFGFSVLSTDYKTIILIIIWYSDHLFAAVNRRVQIKMYYRVHLRLVTLSSARLYMAFGVNKSVMGGKINKDRMNW